MAYAQVFENEEDEELGIKGSVTNFDETILSGLDNMSPKDRALEDDGALADILSQDSSLDPASFEPEPEPELID